MDRIMLEYTTDDKSEATMWFDVEPDTIPDTIRGRIVYFRHDSLSNLDRTSENLRLAWKAVETKDQQKAREKQEEERKKAEENGEEWVEPKKPNPFKMTYDKSTEINPELDIVFDFDLPLTRLDTTAIIFTRLTLEEQEYLAGLKEKGEKGDSVAIRQLARNYQGKRHPFTFERDTQNIRRWYMRTDLGEGKDRFFVTIPAGTFTDISRSSNDSTAYDFALLQKSDFATIIVNVAEDKETPSEYVIEMFDKGDKVVETKYGVKPGKVVFNYVPVDDEMSFRVVQDINGNGIWDSGNLIQRKQPELSRVMTWDDKSSVATKVNWEIEVSIDPAKLFAPESQEDLVKRLDDQERARLRGKAEERAKKAASNTNTHQH